MIDNSTVLLAVLMLAMELGDTFQFSSKIKFTLTVIEGEVDICNVRHMLPDKLRSGDMNEARCLGSPP